VTTASSHTRAWVEFQAPRQRRGACRKGLRVGINAGGVGSSSRPGAAPSPDPECP
jgi:hypothetical protein